MIPSLLLRHRRVFAFSLFALLTLIGASTMFRPQAALAHPLGNFTINRYSRIEPGAGHIYLRYVLDMAEIPTFQEKAKIDRDGDGQVSDAERANYLADKVDDLKGKLYLSINDLPIPLLTETRELSFPAGQGGLSTLRLSLLLLGRFGTTDQQEELDLYYRDDNYSQRLGWKEIVVHPGEGVSLLSSTVPKHDQSDELRTYPQDLLKTPPKEQAARATFVLVGSDQTNEAHPGLYTPQPVTQSPEESLGLLASLVTTKELSLPVIVFALLVAMGLGALHAISPGHGKTIMAAYLVGTRGTAIHALFLGLTVTVSHTLGVLGLGLVTLYASNLITPERLYPWLGLISGGIVLAIGVWLLVGRIRDPHRKEMGSNLGHGHGHEHEHLPKSGNTLRLTWRNLAALGVAGGLLPSASALIILLAAISLHRVGFGLLLILSFSAGMAAVLAGIGLILVYAGKAVERIQVGNRLVGSITRAMPMVTALVVLGSGMVVTARAAFSIGFL